MKLGGFAIAAATNGIGGKSYCDSPSMPSGTMATPRLVSPSFLPRQASNLYASTSGLSLALTNELDGQREFSRTAENELAKKEEGYESRSGSDNMDGASGDDPDADQDRPNKKRYHRHAPSVIQELEASFKECPHPDEKKRLELSKRLNLATRQVKFWFQNRRTQMKAQQERHENNVLRQENERLKAENFSLRNAIRNASCPTCGGPTSIEMSLEEQKLRVENAHIREELERLYMLSGRLYGARPVSPALPFTSGVPSEITIASNFGGMFQSSPGRDLIWGGVAADNLARPNSLSVLEKSMITELAIVAMDELMNMVYAREPLWVPSPETGNDTLDFGEYLRQFPRGIGPKPDGYKSEATRETGVIMVNGLSVVESFLDVNRWMELFPCIITRADVGEVISTGAPVTRSGSLQLMYAELQVPSPVVPTRELYFLRFCKMVGENTWAIVDVSVDNLRGDCPSSVNKYRRRPSGCVIEEVANGYSKVIWVEHSEFDDRAIHHMYRPLVRSGMAFGAHRWVATLRRLCERAASLMSLSLTEATGGLPSEDARRAMLKLAQRMSTKLCNSVSASWNWTTLSGNSGDEEVRVMTRESSSSDNANEPSGLILSAATSVWLPASPHHVFDFLRNDYARKEWDVLSLNGPMEELLHVAKGQDPGNCVSLLRPVKGGGSNMLIFQDCCTDASGSMFVYAPVDVANMDAVMSGGDPSLVSILPSGFVILPDGPQGRSPGLMDESGGPIRMGGALVTVAFQILMNNMAGSRLTLEFINSVNTLVSNTVRNIKGSFLCKKDE